MPMRAVKQKPMANMDFIRTYKTNTQDLKRIHLTINTLIKIYKVWLEWSAGKSLTRLSTDLRTKNMLQLLKWKQNGHSEGVVWELFSDSVGFKWNDLTKLR